MGTPDLVYIEPGIQVVIDSDIPIFYTDSYYWRYDGNVWYRSSYATGGWSRYDAIPQHLRRIDNPHQYARYHPRDRQRVVRDNRAPAPTPAVRDQRGRRPQSSVIIANDTPRTRAKATTETRTTTRKTPSMADRRASQVGSDLKPSALLRAHERREPGGRRPGSDALPGIACPVIDRELPYPRLGQRRGANVGELDELPETLLSRVPRPKATDPGPPTFT